MLHLESLKPKLESTKKRSSCLFFLIQIQLVSVTYSTPRVLLTLSLTLMTRVLTSATSVKRRGWEARSWRFILYSQLSQNIERPKDSIGTQKTVKLYGDMPKRSATNYWTGTSIASPRVGFTRITIDHLKFDLEVIGGQDAADGLGRAHRYGGLFHDNLRAVRHLGNLAGA